MNPSSTTPLSRKERMSVVISKAIDGKGKALVVAACFKVSHRNHVTDSGQVYLFQQGGVKFKTLGKEGKEVLQEIALNELPQQFSSYAQDLRDSSASDDFDDEEKKLRIRSAEAIADKLRDLAFANKVADAAIFVLQVKGFSKLLDTNLDLFAFKDCVIDLATMQRRPGSQMDHLTVSTGSKYSLGSPEEVAELEAILRKSMPLEGELEYFRKCMGQAYSGRKFDDSILVLWGPLASDGKSAVRFLCEAAFGPEEKGGYFRGSNYSLLTEKRKSGAPSNALMGTCKGRILFINETTREPLNPVTFNTLGSAETIVARAVYGHEDVSFRPQTTVLINTNRPLIFDRAETGIARRIVVLPFPSQFNLETVEDNLELHQYVATPKVEHQANLARLVPAFITWSLGAYSPDVPSKPRCVVEATADFLRDPVERFVAEHLVKRAGSFVSFDALKFHPNRPDMLPAMFKSALSHTVLGPPVNEGRKAGVHVRSFWPDYVCRPAKIARVG